MFRGKGTRIILRTLVSVFDGFFIFFLQDNGFGPCIKITLLHQIDTIQTSKIAYFQHTQCKRHASTMTPTPCLNLLQSVSNLSFLFSFILFFTFGPASRNWRQVPPKIHSHPHICTGTHGELNPGHGLNSHWILNPSISNLNSTPFKPQVQHLIQSPKSRHQISSELFSP